MGVGTLFQGVSVHQRKLDKRQIQLKLNDISMSDVISGRYPLCQYKPIGILRGHGLFDL